MSSLPPNPNGSMPPFVSGFTPPVGAPHAGPAPYTHVVTADLAAPDSPPPVDNFPTYLFVARAVFVTLASLFVICICALLWVLCGQAAVNMNVASWSGKEAENQAAAAELPALEKTLAETEAKVRVFESEKDKSQQRLPYSQQDIDFRIDELFRTVEDNIERYIGVLSSLPSNDDSKRWVQTRLRYNLNNQRCDVGRAAKLVKILGNDETKALFESTLATAESVRVRYRFISVSLLEVLKHISDEQQKRFVPVVMELAISSPEVQAKLNPDEAMWKSVAWLAFHRDQSVRGVMQKNLKPDLLFDTALAAFDRSFDEAMLAAKWLSEQTPDEQRRAKVLGVLEPLLLYQDERKFTPALAYARWADDSRLDQLADMLSTPAAQVLSRDVLLRLAKAKSPRLEPILAKHLDEVIWVQSISPLITEVPEVVPIVIKVLRDRVPNTAHLPLIAMIVQLRRAEDAVWLKAYIDRIAAGDRRYPPNFRSQLTEWLEILRK